MNKMKKNLLPPIEWVNPNLPRKKSSKKAGIGILLALMIMLVGIGGYLILTDRLSLFQKEGSDEKLPAQIEQPDNQVQEAETIVSEEVTSVWEETPEKTENESIAIEPSQELQQEESIGQSDSDVEFEPGPYTLTEEEAYFMNVIASYGWERVVEKEGSFRAMQEELEGEDLGYDSSIGAQVVHAQMLAEGLFSDGIILKYAESDNHQLYSKPYYFSILLSHDGEVVCSYEQFQNHIMDAQASAEWTDSYGTYLGDYAIDGDYTTAWVLGGEERTGESITLMLDKERTIYGVLILNGYWKSESTYENNGIVTAFDIYTGSEWQTFAYGFKNGYTPEAAKKKAYDVVGIFYDSAESDRVTVNISGVENGEKYEDICISEIMVLAK